MKAIFLELSCDTLEAFLGKDSASAKPVISSKVKNERMAPVILFDHSV